MLTILRVPCLEQIEIALGHEHRPHRIDAERAHQPFNVQVADRLVAQVDRGVVEQNVQGLHLRPHHLPGSTEAFLVRHVQSQYAELGRMSGRQCVQICRLPGLTATGKHVVPPLQTLAHKLQADAPVRPGNQRTFVHSSTPFEF
jgi:hypothetical protein